MKRDELTKLGLADDVVDQIMAMYGKGIEKSKADLATAQADLDAAKKQLTEANTAIEGFKSLNVDGIKAAADEWKAKAEKAEAEAKQQVSQLRFDHALTGALTGAKARNAAAVRALLKLDDLKLSDDGKIIGLDDQLKTVKETNGFLFEDDTPAPKIVAGGSTPSPLSGDVVENAARMAAGLQPKQ